MSGAAVASALLALSSAALFAVSVAFQQKANLEALRTRDAATRSRRGRNQLLATVLQAWWLGGIALSLVGVTLFAVALALGSLTVAQPIQVTQLIFSVPLGAWVAGTASTSGEWRSAVLVVAGLAGFLVALAPQASSSLGAVGAWAVAVPVVLGVAVVAFLAGRVLVAERAALWGATAGLLLGLQGAALKEASEVVRTGIDLADPGRLWSLPAVLLLSSVGTLVGNLALRAGRLSAAQTTLAGLPPVLGVVLGVTVFGEQVRTAPPALLVAAVGMVVCLLGVVRLARSPSLLALSAPSPAAVGQAQSSRS